MDGKPDRQWPTAMPIMEGGPEHSQSVRQRIREAELLLAPPTQSLASVRRASGAAQTRCADSGRGSCHFFPRLITSHSYNYIVSCLILDSGCTALAWSEPELLAMQRLCRFFCRAKLLKTLKFPPGGPKNRALPVFRVKPLVYMPANERCCLLSASSGLKIRYVATCGAETQP